MNLIYNSTLPRGVELTQRLLNHEKIHMRQQLEIAAASLLLGIALTSPTGAWLLLARLPAPVIRYGLSVGIGILLPPDNQAYRNSCFESEAIYNEHRRDYTCRRWHHLFAWVRYISNAKYPYIPHRDRPPMQDW